jgi:hypothetical protein
MDIKQNQSGQKAKSYKMPKKETSSEYAIRCGEIIKADPKISEETILIMFLEYGQKLLNEKLGK